MTNSPPSTPGAVAASLTADSAVGGDNQQNKATTPTSPFLSAAELASPTALKGTLYIHTYVRTYIQTSVHTSMLCNLTLRKKGYIEIRLLFEFLLTLQ